MFKYASLKEQLIYEQQESAAFKAQNEKNAAGINYIAMMSDIELDSGEMEGDEDKQ